jgi:hypothetical protein
MSSEKTQKKLPSAEEINAYLEQSAARTKLRLPLAKGAAGVIGREVGSAQPVLGGKTKALRTLSMGAGDTKAITPASHADAPSVTATDATERDAWRPFSSDGEG